MAGSAVAIGLRRIGCEVVMIERRTAAESRGGSYLTVAPNGLAALDALGVLDSVVDVGFPTSRNVMVGAGGRVLGSIGAGAPVRDGVAALTAPRWALAARLGELAVDAGAVVERGDAVEWVRQDGAGVVVECASGRSLTGDLLVGADGVNSVVRRAIDPDAPDARYVGLTNFGGITTTPATIGEFAPDGWTFVFGRRAFFGAHPTPDGDVVWFVNVPESPIDRARRDATSESQWRDRLADLLSVDPGPAADLVRAGRLQLAGDNTYDLPEVARWSTGHMVLIGDAVHAPSPSSGQGASMAVEDAVVLAQALRDHPSPADGFTAYERARRRRVERIVAVGARSSSSKIPGPIGRLVMEMMMRLAFRTVVTEQKMAWMTDHRLRWDDPVEGIPPAGAEVRTGR